ncbi:hypothetical protein B0H14DRAFT_3453656 [Mycena olivaceomarginata]|nr:hypothetical protein B0H14DRAFT_3453656 [Mycena olivaceomarginata]
MPRGTGVVRAMTILTQEEAGREERGVEGARRDMQKEGEGGRRAGADADVGPCMGASTRQKIEGGRAGLWTESPGFDGYGFFGMMFAVEDLHMRKLRPPQGAGHAHCGDGDGDPCCRVEEARAGTGEGRKQRARVPISMTVIHAREYESTERTERTERQPYLVAKVEGAAMDGYVCIPLAFWIPADARSVLLDAPGVDDWITGTWATLRAGGSVWVRAQDVDARSETCLPARGWIGLRARAGWDGRTCEDVHLRSLAYDMSAAATCVPEATSWSLGSVCVFPVHLRTFVDEGVMGDERCYRAAVAAGSESMPPTELKDAGALSGKHADVDPTLLAACVRIHER